MSENEVKKHWEYDYTAEERREILTKQIGYQIIEDIKNGISPILKAAPKEKLKVHFNGFNGLPINGLNMILLEAAKNKYDYGSDIWLNAYQAILMNVGFTKENLKQLNGVKIQNVRTLDYEHVYELDENGNKIQLKDKFNNPRFNKDGKPLYKREMEEAIDRNTKEPLFKKDSNGKLILKDGKPQPIMNFKPDIARKRKIPILETQVMYNIHELIKNIGIGQNLTIEEKNNLKDRFIKKLQKKGLNQNSSTMNLNKARVNEKGEILRDINNQEIRLDELYMVNDHTKAAINRYYYARNKNVDYEYPLRKMTKESYVKEEVKNLDNQLREKGQEEQKDNISEKNKIKYKKKTKSKER